MCVCVCVCVFICVCLFVCVGFARYTDMLYFRSARLQWSYMYVMGSCSVGWVIFSVGWADYMIICIVGWSHDCMFCGWGRSRDHMCPPADMGSSSEVQRSLEQVASSWMEMGICFGVGYDLLEPLDRADVKGSLRTVVQLWLGRRYDSALFGEPSWRKLVEVVGWRCGAFNPPLAESIAKEHQSK